MARDLRITTVTVDRPDERWTPEDQRVGPSVAFVVISNDLKHKPAHTVRISNDHALALAEALIRCVRNNTPEA